jgi:hypothetical protein
VHDKLKESHSAIDDLLAQGGAILGSLRGQQQNLHGMRRKALDIGQMVEFKFLSTPCSPIFMAL